ncbi:MAG: hypothetical protein HUU55_03205 [Myxococcales bacterium]|nr:hypothetical protein [Myxococcales bacterium]
MKKVLVMLVLAAVVAGGYFAWDRYFVQQNPTAAFKQTMAAARLGDEEGFLDGFTEDSAKLLRALLAVARSYEFVRLDAYEQLVLADVMAETIDGDTAVLTIQYLNKTRDISMKKDGKTWKIDAFELEDAWGAR